MKHVLIVLMLIFFIVGKSFPQEKETIRKNNINDTISLEEVVVTGSKVEASKKVVPFSVSQISREQIE
ncbi:MAG: hypothetical protein WBC06_19175, partial [Chitinophagaceae bacterium]